MAIVVMDENGKNQLLSFALLSGKKENDFSRFFNFIKQHGIGSVRLIVCDRYQSQVSSISKCFPNTQILFCLRHIKRNIEQNFGNGEITKVFRNAFQMNQTLKEFIDKISPYLENKDQTHYQALVELINSVNNWFPQVTDNYQHCGNNTTNRIEGEFGVLKNRTSHEILSLVDIISTLKVRHDELALSRTKNNLLNDLIIPDTLMDKNESNQLGRMAKQILLKSYKQYCNGEHNLNECNCIAYKWYGLPCCHQIAQIDSNSLDKALICIDCLPKRWIINMNTNIFKKSDIIEEIVGKDHEDWAYNAIRAKIDPVISMATSDSRVQKLLTDLFESVNYLKSVPKNHNPVAVIRPGRRNTHPSLNCMPNNRIKKSYQCCKCGKTGHNAATCFNKHSLNNNLIFKRSKKEDDLINFGWNGIFMDQTFYIVYQ